MPDPKKAEAALGRLIIGDMAHLKIKPQRNLHKPRSAGSYGIEPDSLRIDDVCGGKSKD